MNDLTTLSPADSAGATTFGGASVEVFVFREGASKGEIIYELSSRIPQNEFGLPIFYLRGDMLPSGTHLSQHEVDAAAEGLFYYEGYPTTEKGGSFWNQLPHEPHTEYRLFADYLDQAALIGVRQLDALAADSGKDLGYLSELSKLYYWGARARAYDMFIVAADRKKREFRMRKMEDGHFLQSEQMFNKLMDRFRGENEDWTDELNAKEAVEVMETLVKIQRMSVGLVGQHASSTHKDAMPGESSEAIMRQIAQRAAQGQQSTDSFGAQLEALLASDNGAEIQNLIIQFTAPNNKQSFTEAP